VEEPVLYIPPELEATLCSLPTYALLVDEEHHILYANSSILSQLNLNPKDIIGGYCPLVIHGKNEPIPECPLEECVESNRYIENEVFDTNSGAWLSSAIYPTSLVTTTGKKVYLHMVADITKRKMTEQDLENSLNRLQEITDAGIHAITLIVEKRDPYTAGHQQKVSDLAAAIACEMGCGAGIVEGIRIAGLLHDVGKIGIPIEILSKPGRISDDEFRMIKTHPKVGYDILKGINFNQPIADIIYQHHEKINGSGYPNGLKGEDICLEARILCVADVVEAMSSHRPYRPALGIEKALNEISQNKGVLYDSSVVDACIRLFNEKGFVFIPDHPYM
jgi:putative nucleotidyltransferase with HDIG domain/PAS domain S-box-containing protein